MKLAKKLHESETRLAEIRTEISQHRSIISEENNDILKLDYEYDHLVEKRNKWQARINNGEEGE